MIKSLNKRQLITLLVILVLLIAIPLIIYLVKQQQILKGHAQVNPGLLFVDASHTQLPGDPPRTSTRDVILKIDHTGNNAFVPQSANGGSSTKRVFVTSQTYNANLGGVDGADSKCQSSADGAGLGGSWKAWISDDTHSPANNFSSAFKSGGPYKLINGTSIANNWVDLTDGSISNPINIMENGQDAFSQNTYPAAPVAYAWTDTNVSGQPQAVPSGLNSASCNNWTASELAIPAVGRMGFINSADLSWTDAQGYAAPGIFCNQLIRLYCFEQ